MSSDRLAVVLRQIDDANARDPEHTETPGSRHPAALAYGLRMSATLDGFAPDASDHLRIAARGQHIERWMVPRSSYPEGRTGYLKWRKDLQAQHADRLSAIMKSAGYGEADASRVAALVRKERLKVDPEVQALEDVACLVFLEHYAGELFARYDDQKVIDILQKTARKMSAGGLAAAGKIKVGERLARLLSLALAG